MTRFPANHRQRMTGCERRGRRSDGAEADHKASALDPQLARTVTVVDVRQPLFSAESDVGSPSYAARQSNLGLCQSLPRRMQVHRRPLRSRTAQTIIVERSTCRTCDLGYSSGEEDILTVVAGSRSECYANVHTNKQRTTRDHLASTLSTLSFSTRVG